MKAILIVIAIIIGCNKAYCQTDSYLDFFGHKYYLKGILYETINDKYSFLTQNKGNKYTFCGKNLLKEEFENYTSAPINLRAYKDSSGYMNSADTIREPEVTYNTTNVHYELVDCIDFNNVMDSIQIKELLNENNFSVFWEGKEQLIYGFRILGDCLDYEIAYKVNHQYSHKVNVKKDNKAKENLLKYIDKNIECNKFVIKDIYIYNTKENRYHFINMEMVLFR